MQRTAPSALAAYEAFAPLYDRFTASYGYERWCSELRRVAGKHGARGRSLLDVACGTGKSFAPFIAKGYRVAGCDISPAMLEIARAKHPAARLEPADMRALPSLGRFDLVTCVDDSLNYLLEVDELAATFDSLARNLDPAGICLFDLNTLLAYRTTFARTAVTESAGTVFVWRGETPPDATANCRAAATIDAFSPARAEPVFDRISTRHEQRHFPPELVVRLLGHAGFDCRRIYGVRADGSLDEPLDEDVHPKALYVTRRTRAKGGEPR
jgi:SAM-dependent methyltransferase